MSSILAASTTSSEIGCHRAPEVPFPGSSPPAGYRPPGHAMTLPGGEREPGVRFTS